MCTRTMSTHRFLQCTGLQSQLLNPYYVEQLDLDLLRIRLNSLAGSATLCFKKIAQAYRYHHIHYSGKNQT